MKPHKNPALSFFTRPSDWLGLCTLTFSLLTAGNSIAHDTWDGGAGNGLWSASNNWEDNTAPVPATAGVLTFAGSTQVITENDLVGVIVGGISFTNDGLASTGAFTLNGNAITLGGNITSTGISTGGSSLNSTISTDLVLTGNRTISTDGGSGGITLQHTITISGNISETGGPRALIKGGTGTSGNITLSGNNTYTGRTIIQNGSILVTKIADSGDSNLGYGNLQIGNQAGGGSITYSGTGSTTARELQVGAGAASNHTGGASIFATGANGGTGLKFTATNFTTTQAATTATSRLLTLGGTNTDDNTISGVIGNINGDTTLLRLTKADSGRWILSSNASTYTGVTTISGGVLQVTKLSDGGSNSSIGSSTNAAANLVFNGGSLVYTGAGDSTDRLFTYNSPFNNGGFQLNSSGTGALNFTNTGALVQTGTITHNRFFTFTGTNVDDNIYAGTIGVTGGTGLVNVTKGGSGKWIFTGASNYTGSTSVQTGTLEIRSGASNLTYSVAGLNTSVGDATLIANKSGAGDLAVTFTGYNRGAGASANIVSTGGTNGTDNSVTFGTGAQGLIDKGLFFGGADYAARHTADGYARALAYGSDPNTAAVDTVTASNHVKLTASHTPAATITLLSLNLAGSGVDWNTASGINLNTTGILKAGGGSSAISGAGALGNTGSELVIRTNAATDSLTISTNLTGSGGLTKTGKGTLTLNTGTFNPYTGATHVNEGTLSIGINRHLGAEATGATLHLKGGTLQATGTFGLFNGSAGTNNRAVVLTNQSGIEVTGSNTLTIAGVVSHNTSASSTVLHGFNKLGSGTLELTGANTYNGATNVNEGSLIINGNQSAATDAVSVSNAGSRLMGTGTIGGATTVNSGAIYSPGSAAATVGSQTLASSLTFGSASIFEWDINANSTATGFDTVAVGGALNGSTGMETSIFRVVFGTTAKAGIEDNSNAFWNTFGTDREWSMTSIFGKDFTSGMFTSVQTYDSTGIFDVSSKGSFTITGSSLTWTAVPEPTSTLAGLLLASGLLRRRRA